MRQVYPLVSTLATCVALAGCNSAVRLKFDAAAAELPAAVAEARRLGLPLEGKDMLANPPVAARENAAPALRSAFREMEKLKDRSGAWEQSLNDAVQEPKKLTKLEVDRMFLAVEPALKFAEQAGKKPRVDFDRPYASKVPMDILFPEYGPFKQLAKSVAHRAVLRARFGDMSGSLADFRLAWTLGRFAGSEPNLISGLVKCAIDAIVIKDMQWAATAQPNDQVYLSGLGTLAKDAASIPMDCASYLRGDVYVMFSMTIESLKAEIDIGDGTGDGGLSVEDKGGFERKLFPPGVPEATVVKAYKARALQFWNDAYSYESGHQDTLKFIEHFGKIVPKHTRSDEPTMFCNLILLPIFSQAGEAMVKREASLGAFQGLVAAHLFKLKSGHYPNSLSEAGFEGVDPFSGQSYKLKVSATDARVYSVGPNRTDDQGQEMGYGRGGPKSMQDVVSILPRRKAK